MDRCLHSDQMNVSCVCRIVLLPSKLSYGPVGVKGLIPPDSPLVFYLELRSIGGGMSL